MNTSISIPSFLALVFVLFLTEGCKIEITVPEGGKVVSASHAYDCDSGKTCVVEVNDFHFAETFDAHADEGWIFIGWKFSRGYLCGRSESVCHMSNKGLGQYEAISAIVESDEIFYLEPEFVKGTPFDEALANVQDEELRACLQRVSRPRRYAEQVRYVSCGIEWFFGGSDTVGSLQGIEAFAGIEYLSLVGNGSLTDLQPLGKLSRLQHLSFYVSSSESTSFNTAPLGELKLLDHLDLMMTAPNPDLTGMGNLKRLKELNLRANSPDLSGIGSLESLRKLDLSLSRYISDISPLAGMTKLETLDLSGNAISNISPLAGMTKLETLGLSNNQISDIRPLAGLTQLESLKLRSNPISDIEPLAGLTQLQYLDLYENEISDIEPLAGLTQLQYLDLYVNEISDIRPLAGLTQLQELEICCNEISDIRPLAGLTQLQVLNLGYNKISDISPLAGLTKLEILWLYNNQIPSVVDTLDAMESLREATISNNPISCGEIETLSSRAYFVMYRSPSCHTGY
jgi:Leucine-rich repeat (LRR) protein